MVDTRAPLRRSLSNRMIGGVVAGLAQYFDIDISLARIGYILVSILSAAFPGILLYIIMWIVIPSEEWPAHDRSNQTGSNQAGSNQAN